IAVCIYMALHGASREEIRAYASEHYDLNLNYEDMMAELSHGDEICQVTVPQALWVFLHSDSFEDCLRLAIHIRWDADTLADIACALAEAYYKEIPDNILVETKKRLPKDILEALEAVEKDF
ncbi:MAG: ADP-ribosylglycohydrolase family protein, partial [Bacilli bacterium]|nr:ADP-ribosylglycohydrolase family protein [Bacilli bacterium]